MKGIYLHEKILFQVDRARPGPVERARAEGFAMLGGRPLHSASVRARWTLSNRRRPQRRSSRIQQPNPPHRYVAAVQRYF
eukprot:363291-Chlamydomonas_euryale.AAC.25